jgi:2'-5' RNA ligase
LRAAQLELKQYLQNWHFLPDHQFHLTLRFFGEVPEETVSVIDKTCQRLAPKLHPFALELNAIDFFGTPESARVLFAGGEPSAGLQALVDAIQDEFPDDADLRREFRPHVTLAKARKYLEPPLERINANVLRRLRELGRIGASPLGLNVSTVHREFVLMETIWVGRRVEYEIRNRYRLGAVGEQQA